MRAILSGRAFFNLLGAFDLYLTQSVCVWYQVNYLQSMLLDRGVSYHATIGRNRPSFGHIFDPQRWVCSISLLPHYQLFQVLEEIQYLIPIVGKIGILFQFVCSHQLRTYVWEGPHSRTLRG